LPLTGKRLKFIGSEVEGEAPHDFLIRPPLQMLSGLISAHFSDLN